jgi:hypothetical protein
MLLYFRAGTGAGSARLSHSVTVLRYSLQRDATLLKVGGATQSHQECVFHESSISSSNELKDHSWRVILQAARKQVGLGRVTTVDDFGDDYHPPHLVRDQTG